MVQQTHCRAGNLQTSALGLKFLMAASVQSKSTVEFCTHICGLSSSPNLETRGYLTPTIWVLKTFCSNNNSKSIGHILGWDVKKLFKDPELKSFSRSFEDCERINLRCSINPLLRFWETLFWKYSHSQKQNRFSWFLTHMLNFQKDILFCFNYFSICYSLSSQPISCQNN